MISARRVATLALVGLAACGGGDVITTIETTTFAPSLGVNLAASTLTQTGLYYRDITVGTGSAVLSGHLIKVHYNGYFPDGSSFDANVAPATPFAFTLGAHQVIEGWEEGVAGMNVGGTRQLIVPPALGYGTNGQGVIPPNAILVFSVTVVSSN